jgi:hypothetical protein
MRHVTLAALGLLFSGCALLNQGPVYQIQPWQSSARAAIGRVCSYRIGHTTESEFRQDWDPPVGDLGRSYWATMHAGNMTGYLDSQDFQSAGHRATIYWIGYYWTGPYSYHSEQKRLYALRFANGKLESIYSP